MAIPLNHLRSSALMSGAVKVEIKLSLLWVVLLCDSHVGALFFKAKGFIGDSHHANQEINQTATTKNGARGRWRPVARRPLPARLSLSRSTSSSSRVWWKNRQLSISIAPMDISHGGTLRRTIVANQPAVFHRNCLVNFTE